MADLKFKQGDSVKQYSTFDAVRSKESKGKIIDIALQKVRELLMPKYGPTVQAEVNSENLIEIDAVKGEYFGTIAVRAIVSDGTGTKKTIFPVMIDKEGMRLPDSELLMDKLAGIESSINIKIGLKNKEIADKIANIDKKAEMDKEIADRVEAGEKLETVTQEVYAGKKKEIEKEAIDKTSAEFLRDDGFGNVMDGKLADIPMTLHINKSALPKMEVGDTLMTNGLRYKVIGSSPALSDGSQDGSQFVLQYMMQTESN